MNKNILILLMLATFNFKAFPQAIIRGYCPTLNDGDIVELIMDKYGEPDFPGFVENYQTKLLNHRFELKLPVGDYPRKFSVYFKNQNGIPSNKYFKKNILNYYLEDKDEITINSEDSLTFSGWGSKKFNIIHHLHKIEQAQQKNTPDFYEQPVSHIRQTELTLLDELAYLKVNENQLNPQMFESLTTELSGSWNSKFFYLYMKDTVARNKLVFTLKKEKFQTHFNEADSVSILNSPLTIYNDLYCQGILFKYRFDSCYYRNQDFQTSTYYHYLKKHYHGALLERLITDILFYQRLEPGDDNALFIQDALTFVTNKDFRSILTDLITNRSAGSQAYNFSLVDNIGKVHSMEEFKGKVVFIDFWFTGCGNCIRVTPFIEKIEREYLNQPVAFLSINVDTKKENWLKSLSGGKYTTKYGLNLFGGAQGLQSPISKYYSVDAGPTLIMIDKKGKLMVTPVDPRDDNGENIKMLIKKAIN